MQGKKLFYGNVYVLAVKRVAFAFMNCGKKDIQS